MPPRRISNSDDQKIIDFNVELLVVAIVVCVNYLPKRGIIFISLSTSESILIRREFGYCAKVTFSSMDFLIASECS